MDQNDDILSTLDEILADKIFASSPKSKAFLNYVVRETLAGRGDALNETTIAQDVYDKGADFNPTLDSLIRVSAGRVRSMLELYYSRNPEESRIKISIPVGRYRPKFEIPSADETVDQTKNGWAWFASALNPESLAVGGEAGPARTGLAIASLALLATAALAYFISRPTPHQTEQNEDVFVATVVDHLEQDHLLDASYPMIAVTPFENQTDLERFDFLEDALQKKLVEDISRFGLLSPIVYQGSAEEALAEIDGAYDYVVSPIILSVEPELDLLVKIVNLTASEVIYEQRVRRSFDNDHYIDNLSDIVSELSSNSRASIGRDRREALEEKIDQGVLDISEVEPFECVGLSNRALGSLDPDNFKLAYTCLNTLVEEQSDNATLLSHLGVLTFVGDRQAVFEARSFRPDISADEGLDMMRRAVEIDPDNGTARFFLSEASSMNGDKTEALKHAEIGHMVSPASNSILIGLSHRLIGEGQWERALGLVDEVIERNPVPRGYFYHPVFLWALNNDDWEGLLRVSETIEELGYHYLDIFRFLAAVANEDEEMVEALRPKIVEFAMRDFDPYPDGMNTISRWTALYSTDELVSKTQNLFIKGGVISQDGYVNEHHLANVPLQ
ncbi:MAG: hypothetical protein ABJG15_10485 [Hyphomonadaceae bacterium]